MSWFNKTTTRSVPLILGCLIKKINKKRNRTFQKMLEEKRQGIELQKSGNKRSVRYDERKGTSIVIKVRPTQTYIAGETTERGKTVSFENK